MLQENKGEMTFIVLEKARSFLALPQGQAEKHKSSLAKDTINKGKDK